MKKFLQLFCVAVAMSGMLSMQAGTISIKLAPGQTKARIAVTTTDGKLQVEGATGTWINAEWVDFLPTGDEIKFTGDITKFVGTNTNLAEVNAAGNENLAQLLCFKNPNLTKIDVTGCPKLTKFYCNECALTSIDVSQNPELFNLICYDNKLNDIDVSHNTKLNWLDCGTNNIKAIDLSKNSTLESLYCSKNHIKDLNFTPCPKIKEILCSENEIAGTSMDNMIKTLPTREPSDEAVIYIIEIPSDIEKNVCTKKQVKALKDKHWTVIAMSGYDTYPYQGSDEGDSGNLEINSNNDAQPIGYFNINGARLSQPQLGINIVKMNDGTTHKIVVK